MEATILHLRRQSALLLTIVAVAALLPWGGTLAATGPEPETPLRQDAGPESHDGEFPGAAKYDNRVLNDGEVFTVERCAYLDPEGLRTRDAVRVGVNDHGSIGIRHPVLGASGFQGPQVGAAFESLAVGWWGEGYAVDFGQGLHTFYPSGPRVGHVERVDDVLTESGRHHVYRVTVTFGHADGGDRKDRPLLADFEFVVDRQTCDLTLRTTFTNQADYALPLRYKRIVDWDSALGQAGTFSNAWRITSDGHGVEARTHLIPGLNGHVECRTRAVGTTLPWLVDLQAWDDLNVIGPNGVVNPGAGNTISGDWNAGFHYARDLPPAGVWTSVLKYDCSLVSVRLPLPKLPEVPFPGDEG